MANGMPRNTARVAAKEKLSTVMIEMTVDAKQRLSALSTSERGAVSLGADGMLNAVKKSKDRTAKITTERT